ncbi:Voltage-gated Ion Channel (VIC) Superfamily [Phytophthora infestans T30-4]|uniref:Voltage-gated Ion Channel (VIC) Superfamily n=2 Tax=Phytophthora infestans TaxID=4787 RepID=D0MX57_PHYIT|nr:Voltage-gated Ion Channel (VIC) Superfamily [Phytophthora infestans T30-4]EEY64220.1 Voltage-gated Ion Channel (VIC) Superfamily [Phytophthora infestans T30-4]|eukprot:XP_002907656.1 Voltage-gated Ion Channel (VIC) Superfamily [Phytophthora infestans T30-4]
MVRCLPIKPLVLPAATNADDVATNLEAGIEEGKPDSTVPAKEVPGTTSTSPSKLKSVGRLNRNESIKADTQQHPNVLRRTNTWARSTGSLLRMASENATINVLRTSLFEMHDRMSYRWVLHPQSPFKAFWDLLSAAIVVYYSWIIPFMLCFYWYEPSTSSRTFMKVLDVWGFADIALRFRTGYIEYGAVVMNPRKIRQAYTRSVWFPIDLASSIPFEYFVKDTASVSTRKTFKMIKYIKLPRLLRLGRFVKYLKRYKRYSSLTISLNAMIFSGHVAGCLWVAILKPCADAIEATRSHCQDGGEMDVYWVAFHHGIVSLLGVSATHVEANDRFLSGGYNHIASDDLNSTIYLWSSAVSVYGAIVSAILFGTIIGLVQRAENAFRKKMDHVTHEMDALSLPKPLRNRALSEQLNLLHDPGMSMTLRRQIAIYLFKDNLLKIPFFQLATDAVLGMICMQLHQVIYMPDDFIIQEGEIGKELFMIVKGIVRVLPPNGCKKPEAETIILLSEGDFFGEIGVVMEVERTRSVKAECMAELCVLAREGFDKILVEFPEFATAMKKLIVKRVGEMWKDDGPERMEKMTALADAKMKKTIQTYKNMDKFRNKTRALATFRPRLSNILSATGNLTPVEIRGDEGSGLTKNEIVAAAAAAAAEVATTPTTPDKPPLDAITEDGVDERKTSSTTSILGVAASGNIYSPGRPSTDALELTDRRSQGAVASIPSTRPSPLQLQQLEMQLRVVEQKMESSWTASLRRFCVILSLLPKQIPYMLYSPPS